MVELLLELGRELADAVFPRRCYLCGAGAPGGIACAQHALPAGLPGPRCGTCASALPGVVPGGALCAACRLRSPGFRALVALADYRAQPVCRPWLFALKYGGRRDLGQPLGRALGEAWRERAPREYRREPLFVPVPLHWKRRLERGYDQARALAVHAARAAAVPWEAVLVRRWATGVQGGPGAPSRAANVRGAFGPRRRFGLLPSGRRTPDLSGRHVWLVDDVVTSGATVAECARTLRRCGAASVCVLAVARAGTGGSGGAGAEVGWAP